MRRCASCQAEVPADASFCTRCGAPLDQQEDSPTRPNEFAATLIDQPAFDLPDEATEIIKADDDKIPNPAPAPSGPLGASKKDSPFANLSQADATDDIDLSNFHGVEAAPELPQDMTLDFPTATAVADPLIGRVIAGKFKIEDLLGVGGMGRVYQAQHLVLEKTVALKVLHQHYASDETLVHRFQREARAASRIEHPNIIQIFDFGQENDGTLYMAMELLRGRDLDKIIIQDAPMPEARLARIAMQIASALGEAHRQGVVHRDLKPANIVLLDRAEHRDFVKLFDFGIAKLEQSRGRESRILTTGGVVCGTPEFMSPEQVRGEALDGRSDLYALGVVLYLMATGQLPLLAKNPIDTAAMQVTTRAKAPRQLRPDISTALESIIVRLLKKKPEARYADAHALFKDLSQIASSEADDEFRSEEITTDTLMHPTPAVQKQNDSALTKPAVLPVSAQAKTAGPEQQDAPNFQNRHAKNVDGQNDHLQNTDEQNHNDIDDDIDDLKPSGTWREHKFLLPAIALLLGLTLSALGFALWQHLSKATSNSTTTGTAKNSPKVTDNKSDLAVNNKSAQNPLVATASKSHIRVKSTEVSVVTTAETPQNDLAPSHKKSATGMPRHNKKTQGSKTRVNNISGPTRRLAKLLRQGDIRYEAGDYASALRYYKKAADIAPEQSKVQRRLTMGYFNKGEAEKACVALKHFLQLQPHPPGEEYYRDILANGCRQ